MSSMTGSVTAGLYAALLLARGRIEGLSLVAADAHAAGRSFWALVPCLSIVVGMRLLAVAPAAPGLSLAHALARDVLVFAVSWFAYALLSHRVARALGIPQRWPRFIAAWNWCNVLENLLVLLGALPGVLGAPTIIDQACQLFALGWALWIEWYATRTALGVAALVAVWLVMVDETIGLMANGLAQALGSG